MNILFIAAWLSVAGSAEPLTLGAAVDAALARSPAVEQAQESVREAEAGLSQARLSSLPRLTAKSAFTRSDDPVYVFGSLLEQQRFGAQNFALDSLNNPGYLTNFKSSLEIGMPLFTGFALYDQRALGRIQVAAAGAGARESEQATRCRVSEVFLRVLLDRTLIADETARIASAADELSEAGRLKARGLVLGSDYYAAQALLGALQAAKVRSENELTAARATLETMLQAPPGSLEPAGSLDDASYSTAPLTSLLDAALRDRQDIRRASAAEEAATVLARREKLSVLPTLDAFASVDTNTSDFASNPTNRMIGVRAALPIGDPTYFARGSRGDAARRAARAGRAALEQSARVEVVQRYQEYEAAAAMLPILRDSVEKADKSLALFRPLYREGRQSILDVLRAEQALLDARAGYLGALFAAHAGYARLQLAAGRLDAAAIGEIDRRLGGSR